MYYFIVVFTVKKLKGDYSPNIFLAVLKYSLQPHRNLDKIG